MFSVTNNPGFVKHCVVLLLLTSKQNIMKEQIAFRDNQENRIKSGGKYEKLVDEKNRKYLTDRNRIKEEILKSPESLIQKIEGADNRAFLSFVTLILFRDYH